MARAQWLQMLLLLLCAAVVFGCLPGCSRKAAETPVPPAAEPPEPAVPEPEPPVERTAPEPYRPPAMGARRLDNGVVTIGDFRVRVTPIAGEGVWRARRVRVVRRHLEVFNVVYPPDAAAYFLDLNSDGLQECIIVEYSMGAHCCFDYTGLHFDPKTGRARKILSYDGGNDDLFYGSRLLPAPRGSFRSIVTGDDRFAYFADLPFAYSPFPEKVLSYSDGAYHAATKRHPALLRQAQERAFREIARTLKRKDLWSEDERICRTRAAALEGWVYGYLLGEERSTVRRLKRVASPEVTAWLSRYRKDAVELVKRESF